MYAGHFATALLLHRATRQGTADEHPVWIPFVGVGVLDIVNSVLVALGIERVTPSLGDVPGFELTAIDWDHSLVMAGAWALLFALPWWRNARRAALAAAAVFSHFVLDILVHNHDMALWPGSATRLGFEGWKQIPWGAWSGELLLSLICITCLAVPRRDGTGRLPWATVAAVGATQLSLNLSFSPAWSPLREAAARLPAAQACTGYSVLVGLGFVLPAVLLPRLLSGRFESI